jgi:hypothetical protein
MRKSIISLTGVSKSFALHVSAVTDPHQKAQPTLQTNYFAYIVVSAHTVTAVP